MKLAAVTMAYNEPDFVPRWIRHYAAQVGTEHCYLIDHGSDDGSTEGLGAVNRLRIPRSPQDDAKRAAALSDFCAALLQWYDWGIYSDIDELLVADPAHQASLHDLCATSPLPVITAVGLNVNHLPQEEPAIDPVRPVSVQRRWAMLATSMCKPLLISRKVRWTPGFHSCDAPVAFGPVMLFHLRHYDLQQGLTRLAKARSMAWAREAEGSHQKIADKQWHAGRMQVAARPRKTDVTLELADSPLRPLLAQIVAEQHARAGELYKINIDRVVLELWRIPDRFVGSF
jgi:hypothetical protein